MFYGDNGVFKLALNPPFDSSAVMEEYTLFVPPRVALFTRATPTTVFSEQFNSVTLSLSSMLLSHGGARAVPVQGHYFHRSWSGGICEPLIREQALFSSRDSHRRGKLGARSGIATESGKGPRHNINGPFPKPADADRRVSGAVAQALSHRQALKKVVSELSCLTFPSDSTVPAEAASMPLLTPSKHTSARTTVIR